MGAKTDRELIYRQAMMDEIRRLIEKEADFAEKNRKCFRDGGDLIGPMGEELDEVSTEGFSFRREWSIFEREIYRDDLTLTEQRLTEMVKVSVRWAMEAIQCGAVALKALHQSTYWE